MNFFLKNCILFTAHRRFKKKTVRYRDGISAVVFTKDRPMQLNSLLESYFYYTSNSAPLTIIYSCSDENYQMGYNELATIWKKVVFVRETNFYDTLKSVLKSIVSEKIFFLVDDIIFTRHYNLSDISSVNCQKYLPSLRLGKNISYSYVRNKEIVRPDFIPYNSQLLSWKWSKKNSYWSYPLSLDGHIFLLHELKVMIDLISFNAPNSLEQSLQIFNPLYFKRAGISFPLSVMLNTPWNMVQTEIINQNENISKEYLLTLWHQGKRIQFESYHNYDNKSCHEALPLILSEREILKS
jgi:hypothetical protein